MRLTVLALAALALAAPLTCASSVPAPSVVAVGESSLVSSSYVPSAVSPVRVMTSRQLGEGDHPEDEVDPEAGEPQPFEALSEGHRRLTGVRKYWVAYEAKHALYVKAHGALEEYLGQENVAEYQAGLQEKLDEIKALKEAEEVDPAEVKAAEKALNVFKAIKSNVAIAKLLAAKEKAFNDASPAYHSAVAALNHKAERILRLEPQPNWLDIDIAQLPKAEQAKLKKAIAAFDGADKAIDTAADAYYKAVDKITPDLIKKLNDANKIAEPFLQPPEPVEEPEEDQGFMGRVDD